MQNINISPFQKKTSQHNSVKGGQDIATDTWKWRA